MQKKLTYIMVIMIIVTASFFYKLYASGDLTGIKAAISNDYPEPTTNLTESTTLEETYNTINIYLCGHIVNPGIYEILPGRILNDVVTMAGGLTEDAALNRINLVYVLKDNLTIYIPSETEIINNQYDSSLNISGIIIGSASTSDTFEVDNGLININTATKEELCSLPGIGSSTADKIIKYREETPFSSIEDIMNVQGIGQSKYNSIKDLICV